MALDRGASWNKTWHVQTQGWSDDDGFFGQGIYLTLDSEYAIEEYGRRQDGQPEVALVVCAVLVGSAFPVVEMPQCAPARVEPQAEGVPAPHAPSPRLSPRPDPPPR